MRNTTRMGRRSTGRYLVLGAVGLSLVAVACGSSGSKAATTTAAATPATTKAADKPATTAAPAKTATTAAPAATTTAPPATTVKAGEKAVAGGELKVGLESGVSTLDPALNLAQPADKDIALTIYDPLINFDKDGKFVPFLAETVTNTDDLKSYTMKLHKGVKFHDGTDFNADSVIKHFERMIDPATKSNWASSATDYGVPTKVDDYTVTWNFKTASIGFLNDMAGQMGYIPSPTATAKDSAGFGLAPVGTGPFKMTKFESGGQVVVEKNPTYWRKAENGDTLPYLDKITFNGIPDSGKRLTAVQNGEVDLIQTADTATVVKAEKAKLKVQRVSGSSSTIVMFNNKKAPTDDVKVRQAMSYATNKKEINDIVYDGARTESYSAFAPDSPYFNKSVTAPKYDPEKAKALLKEYGKPVDIVLECIPSPEADQILQLVKQQWEAVGMKVTLKSQEQGAYVTRMFSKVGDWTTACFRNNHFIEPDQIRAGLTTDDKANIIFYGNPEMDKLFNEGRSTSDFAKRKAAYDKVQELLAKDVPTITTLYDIFGQISTDKVFGVPVVGERNSLGAIQLAGVWKKP
jgi:peptide/nickel transport system substrate-binding protein